MRINARIDEVISIFELYLKMTSIALFILINGKCFTIWNRSRFENVCVGMWIALPTNMQSI